MKMFFNTISLIWSNAWWLNIFLTLIVIYSGRNRQPRSTMMWIMVLTLFPIVGFIPYILMGRDTRRINMFNFKMDRDLAISDKIKLQQEEIDRIPSKLAQASKNEEAAAARELALLGLNLGGSLITADNDVEIFVDGREKFKSLIRDIEGAKYSIEFQYYIIKSDNLGKTIIDKLIEAAGRGVKVRFLTDGVGGRYLRKSEVRDMKRAGIETAFFYRSILKYFNLRLNYRNHRKLVCIDDEIGYCGGFNVGDEYLGKYPKFGYWRDTHLRIRGSAAKAIKTRFLQDWFYASGLQADLEPPCRDVSGSGDTPCQLLTSGPDTELKNIKLSMTKMIMEANHSVYIQTPYFIPDAGFYEVLVMILHQGVEVNLMIPDRPDHPIVYPATLSFVSDIIDAGGNVYRYDGGFLHSKAIMVDDSLSMVGSANIDERSFSLNFEASMIIYSAEVNAKLREAFIQDMKKSTKLTREKLDKRSFFIRAKEPICRLFAPLL